MLPNTLKIDGTHQNKNDEINAGLYSCKKCYVSVTLFLVMLTLIHYIITLRYAFGNLTTE